MGWNASGNLSFRMQLHWSFLFLTKNSSWLTGSISEFPKIFSHLINVSMRREGLSLFHRWAHGGSQKESDWLQVTTQWVRPSKPLLQVRRPAFWRSISQLLRIWIAISQHLKQDRFSSLQWTTDFEHDKTDSSPVQKSLIYCMQIPPEVGGGDCLHLTAQRIKSRSSAWPWMSSTIELQLPPYTRVSSSS